MARGFQNILGALLLLVLYAGAQPPAPGRSYEIGLAKDNLSWMWQARFYGNYSAGLKSRFFLNNQFDSNLFRETTSSNKWKDENNLETGWIYRTGTRWTLSTRLKSHVFSDENSFVKFSKHLLMQEVAYRPAEKVQLTPALGWASEDIYSFRDQGWYTQLEMQVTDYDLWGYHNSTTTRSAWFFFPGRKNQEHKYYTGFKKEFSRFARDSIQVGYEFIENSYHLAQEGKLENVEVNARYLFNQLNYDMSDHTTFELQTRLQNRDVSQNNPALLNRREELNLLNNMKLAYAKGRFRGQFLFTTSQVSNLSSRLPQNGTESRNDIQGLQTAFNLDFRWQMSGSDAMRLAFSYTKYEYTSPDSTQHIDEDDLRFLSDLSYHHRFSRYFSGSIHGNVYLYHQIYIHATRSGNNNWNRIFQLAPAFTFRIPGVLKHSNRLKILANYTVYDFEDILPQVRSYIYRKLIYTDSLSLSVTRALELVSIYQLEKEDNGTFFKDLFAEQVSRELTSHFVDISVVYRRLPGLKLIAGWNWYLRGEWRHSPSYRRTRDYRAFSPRLTILYNIGKRLLLHATYSPRVYRDMGTPRRYYVTGMLRLKYLF